MSLKGGITTFNLLSLSVPEVHNFLKVIHREDSNFHLFFRYHSKISLSFETFSLQTKNVYILSFIVNFLLQQKLPSVYKRSFTLSNG